MRVKSPVENKYVHVYSPQLNLLLGENTKLTIGICTDTIVFHDKANMNIFSIILLLQVQVGRVVFILQPAMDIGRMFN